MNISRFKIYILNIRLILLTVSLTLHPFAVSAFEPFTQEDVEKLGIKLQEIYQAEGGKRSKDEIWAGLKKELLEAKAEAERPGLNFQPHKLNYFILNTLPPDEAAQVKFQISAKYRVFEGSLGIFKRNYFPLYFAYTQKSFWDIGRYSSPFEESNYNPEVFLDYRIDADITNNVKLRNFMISPYEHESNGLDGVKSRSWNRSYIACSLGFGTTTKSAPKSDRASMYFKLWNAYSYSDQDNYLKALGKDERFLDYAGRGEVGFSIRELPIISSIKWFENNHIDFKTRIFREWDKGSYEIGYHQNIPSTNFSLYAQYWDGYGESLLRFDERDSKLKAGLSFFY